MTNPLIKRASVAAAFLLACATAAPAQTVNTSVDSVRHEVVITEGGMANMVAAIVPDDPRLWPAIDPADPTFLKDVQSLGISWTPANKAAGMVGTRRQ